MFRSPQLEFAQYITPDGTVYDFDNSLDQFMLAGFRGLGMPGITYQTQRGPFQDGETPLGFKLEPRIIQLLHRRNGCSRDEYWAIRANLLDIFRPNRQFAGVFETGQLRIIQPDLTKRDLNVFIQSGPEFVGREQGRWDEFSIQEVIQFIAHDPVLYDPDEHIFSFALPSGGIDELTYDITFPIEFSSNATMETDTIAYNGTYKSYPKLILVGPMTNPIIRNLSTNTKIELTMTINLAQTVTIDLSPGNKSVTDDMNNNLIGNLTTDSDLAGFYLAPSPEAPSGINSFGVWANEISSGVSTIYIRYFEKFIGI